MDLYNTSRAVLELVLAQGGGLGLTKFRFNHRSCNNTIQGMHAGCTYDIGDGKVKVIVMGLL